MSPVVPVESPPRPAATWAEAAGLAVAAAALAPGAVAVTLAAGVGAAAWAHAEPARRAAVATRWSVVGLMAAALLALAPPPVLPGVVLPLLALVRGVDRRRPGASLHAVREGWLRGAGWASAGFVAAALADVSNTVSAGVAVLLFAAILPYLVATTPDEAAGGGRSAVGARVRLTALATSAGTLAMVLVVAGLVVAGVRGSVGDGAIGVVLQPFVDVAVSVVSVVALALWGIAAVIAGVLPDVPLIDVPVLDVDADEPVAEAAPPDAGSLPDVVTAALGVALVLLAVAALVWVVRRSLEARDRPPAAAQEPVFRERRTRLGSGGAAMLGGLLARRQRLPQRGAEAERVRRAFRAVAAASAPPLDEGRPPARSAREVGLRVVDAAPDLGPAPLRLVDLYHAARYGPADVPPESAAAAEALAAEICASLETPVRSEA